MTSQASANTVERLPDPAANPGKDIVIWDGKCNFCLKQVQRLRGFAGPDRLAYLSLHDPRVAVLCPDLTFEQLMDQMWVITPSGEQYGGADAGRYLSRKLPLLWWLAPLLHIPFSMPLWRWLYRLIANRRYAIAGTNCDEDGTCHLHQR
jgi:predicted DCC family thiol-disulfide oxidoreductase YuxK